MVKLYGRAEKGERMEDGERGEERMELGERRG